MRVHIFHRTPFLKDSKLQNGDGLVRAQLHYAMLRGNTYFLLLVFKFLLFNLFSQRCFQSLHYLQDMALKGSRWRKWSNWHERGHFSSRSVKNYQVEVSFLFLFFDYRIRFPFSWKPAKLDKSVHGISKQSQVTLKNTEFVGICQKYNAGRLSGRSVTIAENAFPRI